MPPEACHRSGDNVVLLKSLFITGATGFVGSHAARKFLAEGWNVRALVRRPDRPGLLPEGVEVVAGSLADSRSFLRALEGSDAVVHAAGVTKARSLAEYRETNVEGARRMAEAAAVACPGAMFVLVSSQSAAGPARNGRPVGERDEPHPVSWYGQSKLEGEEAVGGSRHGPWCAIRPSVVYGPGDPGLFQFFSIVARGWVPIIAGGEARIQLIAASDLARILFAAAGSPSLTGRRIFAAADVVTMGEIARFIGSLRKSPARRIPIPAFFVRLAGLAESLREFTTRKSRPFNRDKAAEILQESWLSDASAIETELGISNLKPWKQGMRETALWYQQEGWLADSFSEL